VQACVREAGGSREWQNTSSPRENVAEMSVRRTRRGAARVEAERKHARYVPTVSKDKRHRPPESRQCHFNVGKRSRQRPQDISERAQRRRPQSLQPSGEVQNSEMAKSASLRANAMSMPMQ